MKTLALIIAIPSLMLAGKAGASGPITGKVAGVFNRYGIHGVMYGGENLRRYIKDPGSERVVCLAGR